jgi:hypothetical protein
VVVRHVRDTAAVLAARPAAAAELSVPGAPLARVTYESQRNQPAHQILGIVKYPGKPVSAAHEPDTRFTGAIREGQDTMRLGHTANACHSPKSRQRA